MSEMEKAIPSLTWTSSQWLTHCFQWQCAVMWPSLLHNFCSNKNLINIVIYKQCSWKFETKLLENCKTCNGVVGCIVCACVSYNHIYQFFQLSTSLHVYLNINMRRAMTALCVGEWGSWRLDYKLVYPDFCAF